MRNCRNAVAAVQHHFNLNSPILQGVYDRRFPTIMFAARSISALLAVLVILYGLSFTSPIKSGAPQTTDSPSVASSIQLNGTLITASDGTHVVFQRASNPRGSILFFHGCSHSATDFFPAGPACSTCLGLPEELHLVRLALARNLSPIAVSSTDRSRKCWRSSRQSTGPDYDRVTTALHIASSHGVYSLKQPLYAVGASSGGYFATSLSAPDFKVSAAHAIVASAALPESTLPHAFTHMGHRDMRTASNVKNDIDQMSKRGIPTIEFSVPPLPITEEFLKKAFPLWDHGLVQDVRNTLFKDGLIDSKTGLLNDDPRRSKWRDSVRHLADKMQDTLVADQSPLSEEMNRAWGAHEMTADHFDEVLEFFDNHA